MDDGDASHPGGLENLVAMCGSGRDCHGVVPDREVTGAPEAAWVPPPLDWDS